MGTSALVEKFWFAFFVSLSGLIVSGCVSIDINKNTVKRAENVEYKDPAGSFEEFSSETLDKGWRNTENGNAISFVSDCENPSDPSLDSIESGVLSGLTDVNHVLEKREMYNGRAAKHSVVTGKVDGIPSQIELMVFKKNNCIFVLSYVALVNTYEANKGNFQKFLEGFKAP